MTQVPMQEIDRTSAASVGPPAVTLPTQRPRSVPGEEAYLRSELEQAAIDIAAGR